MYSDLRKIPELFYSDKYEECLQLCKSTKYRAPYFPLSYYKILSRYHLDKEFINSLLDRAISIFPANDELIAVKVTILLDNNEPDEEKIATLCENGLTINSSNAFFFLLKAILSYKKDEEMNDGFRFNMTQFFTRMRLIDVFRLEHESWNNIILLLIKGIKDRTLLKEYYSLLLSNQEYIVMALGQKAWKDLNNKMRLCTEERYFFSWEYKSLIKRSLLKFEIEDFEGAFTDAEKAYDLCENYDMDNPDLSQIRDLMIRSKIQSNDFEWLRKWYEERILDFPEDAKIRIEFAEICLQNEKYNRGGRLFREAIHIITTGQGIKAGMKNSTLDKGTHSTDGMIGYLRLCASECLTKTANFKAAKAYLSNSPDFIKSNLNEYQLWYVTNLFLAERLKGNKTYWN